MRPTTPPAGWGVHASPGRLGASTVTFDKLAAFIESYYTVYEYTMNITAKKLKVPKEETTVEAVVHMNKDQEAVTASLVRGAGRPGSCPHLAGQRQSAGSRTAVQPQSYMSPLKL